MLKPQTKLAQKQSLSAKQLQSVRLLQHSSLELHQEIQLFLEQNPFLELELENYHALEEVSLTEIEGVQNAPPQGADNRLEPQNMPESLQDHLLWQLDTIKLSKRAYTIGRYLIDMIDTHGYFQQPMHQFIKTIRLSPKPKETEVAKVLETIQQFDPTGVGAKDLQECLLLQLQTFPDYHPSKQDAIQILRQHYTMFYHKEFDAIQHELALTEVQLKAALATIQTLAPHPGDAFDASATEYILPDLVAQKYKEQWQVSLYNDIEPHIRLQDTKHQLLAHTHTDKDKQFIHHAYDEAQWFKKCLQNRNATLKHIAQIIIQQQIDFFNNGPSSLQTLTLEKVAQQSPYHLSTISRAVRDKYIQTPHGTYALKYFFKKKHAGSQNTGAAEIQAQIKAMISQEALQKPLSDEAIRKHLDTQGIHVTRRTVSNYREVLGIPKAARRKVR